MTATQRRSSKAAFHENRRMKRIARKAYGRWRKRMGTTVHCVMLDGPHMGFPIETPFPPSKCLTRLTESPESGIAGHPLTDHIYQLEYLVHCTDGWLAYYKHVT